MKKMGAYLPNTSVTMMLQKSFHFLLKGWMLSTLQHLHTLLSKRNFFFSSNVLTHSTCMPEQSLLQNKLGYVQNDLKVVFKALRLFFEQSKSNTNAVDQQSMFYCSNPVSHTIFCNYLDCGVIHHSKAISCASKFKHNKD